MTLMPSELDPDAEDEQGESHVVWSVWLGSAAVVLTVIGFGWFENAAYLAQHHNVAGGFTAVALWIIGLGP